MSMELFVIFAAAQAPDAPAWNKALAAADSPATFVETYEQTIKTGYLPVAVNGKRTGFEFYRSESAYPELAAHYPAIAHLKIDKPVVYSLIYHGDFEQCAAVFYSASVLVAGFGGTALESQGGIVMSATDLVNAAKECQAMANNP